MTYIPLPPLLNDLRHHGFEEFHRRLDAAGHGELREGHGCVFRFVEEEGSRLTDLAERSGLSKQAVGEVVDHLERLGYVERTPDAEDRRAKVIRLTPRGRDANATALGIFAEIEREWAQRIGAERVAALREALEALTAADAVPA